MGKFGRFFTDTHYAYLIQRCDEGFVVREFKVYNCYLSRQYQMPILHHFECRRAFYGKNAEPLNAYYWGDYKHKCTRWIETNLCGTSHWNDFSGKIYGKTLPSLSKNEMKRTGIYEAVKSGAVIDPELYLAVWRQFPNIEQLAKSNLPRITQECTRDYKLFEKLYKKAQSGNLTKVLGIDALELRRLRNNRGGKKFLMWLQFEKLTQRAIPDHAISWFCEEAILPENVRFIEDRMHMEQIYNYVRRQMREGKMKSKEVLTTWADYLSMAVWLGIDHFVHFSNPQAMNMDGMSEAIVEAFTARGWLHTVLDFYSLDQHKEKIIQMDGWDEKSWNNLWDAVQKSRKTTFERFLIAMNIPMIGNHAISILAEAFGSRLDKFTEAVDNMYDFTFLPDFEETLHNNIHEWFFDEENRYIWDALQTIVKVRKTSAKQQATHAGLLTA